MHDVDVEALASLIKRRDAIRTIVRRAQDAEDDTERVLLELAELLQLEHGVAEGIGAGAGEVVVSLASIGRLLQNVLQVCSNYAHSLTDRIAEIDEVWA